MANEAPERIWAKLDRATVYMDGSSPLACSNREFRGSQEYIRADIATLFSDAARDELTELDQLRDRVKELEKALNLIDALDPEEHVYGCSADALRGLIIQMGQAARRVREGGKVDG